MAKEILNPEIYVLTREVMAVAKHTVGDCWKAYIGIVPGRSHNEEWQRVVETGDTLNERLARFLFPDFSGPYDR